MVETRSAMPILFVTGYADLTAVKEVGESRIVQKPFKRGELIDKIGLLLGTVTSDNVIPLRQAAT